MTEASPEARSGSQGHAPEERIQRLKQLLVLVEKTHKTMRLYQAANEVSRRLQRELFDAMARTLDSDDELSLQVTEQTLMVDDEVVYRAAERADSLAFLFHRDGIRTLGFLPGLDEPELQSFMDALVRVSVLAHQSDDLVTLFWERDFSHIKYVAVEELTEQRHGPTIEQQLAHGSLGGDGRGGTSEAVSLADVSRPVARMPVKECVLTEEEVEALRQEITAEEDAEPLRLMVDLAVELSLLGGSEEELGEICATLVASLDDALGAGRNAAVAEVVSRLDGLSRTPGANGPAVDELQRVIFAHLASPPAVRQFLAAVGLNRASLSADDFAAYIRRLGPPAMPPLVASMGSLPHAGLRRNVAEAVIAAGSVGAAAVEHFIIHATEVSKPQLDELLFIVRRLPGEAGLTVVRRLLGRKERELRRQAALALGPYQDGAVGEMWVELLVDPDPEMRGLALTALLRGARPELAQPLADATMNEAFEAFSVDEKKRWFAAIARLGGPPSAQWMAEILWRPRRSHFLPRGEKEMVAAVVHGLGCLPPATARSAFSELVESGDRHVRAACRKALKELTGD